MTRFTLIALLAALAAALTAAGCGATSAVQESQRLQLAAMMQYRDEMASYHSRVATQFAEEKRVQLDAALAASLAQSADADGRVPVAVALEKSRKRAALEEEFRANLARLDGQFAQRQEAIGRAISLAEDTLEVLGAYDRMAALVRGLLVRDPEILDAVHAFEMERSPADE
jgi:hypothetical protein